MSLGRPRAMRRRAVALPSDHTLLLGPDVDPSGARGGQFMCHRGTVSRSVRGAGTSARSLGRPSSRHPSDVGPGHGWGRGFGVRCSRAAKRRSDARDVLVRTTARGCIGLSASMRADGRNVVCGGFRQRDHRILEWCRCSTANRAAAALCFPHLHPCPGSMSKS